MEITTTEQQTAETHTHAGDAEPLDPRSIPLARATGAIGAAVLAMASLVVLAATFVISPTLTGAAVRGGLWMVVVALAIWHAYQWPVIDYRHSSYRLDALGLEIRRGVIWRTVINVPRSRIQHTDVSQGPLERRYGLGTLVVYTAGSDYARVSLSGLDHARALHIREQLLPTGDSGAV